MLQSLLFFFALQAAAPGTAVGPSGAVLRDTCNSDAKPIAALEAGAPVRVRMGISGDLGSCYKVQAGDQSGYVLAKELASTETFDRARREAAETSAPQMIRSEISRMQEQAHQANEESGSTRVSGRVNDRVAAAVDRLNNNQPREALEMLEDEMKRERKRDAFTLAAAGMAAYQSDQPKLAVDYWTESLEVSPSPNVQRLLSKAKKELAGDSSKDRAFGQRFILRYEGREVTPEAAHEIIDALDSETNRIAGALGCRFEERVTAVVQTLNSFRATTDAFNWSTGLYDGRIRVVAPANGRLTAELRLTLAHEVVHACLARLGNFPSWFHEGMAQRWSGETDGRASIPEALQKMKNGALPGVEKLDSELRSKDAEKVRLAYALALAAVDSLYADRGEDSVRNLLRNPERVPEAASTVTRQLASR
jgi:hypothetical protein